MAEDNSVNLDSIIKEQQETIKTLVDNIRSDSGKKTTQDQQNPIYWYSPQTTEKTPNYTLYILIGAVLYLLLRKGR